MQGRRYRPDDVVADKHREHENRQAEDKRIDNLARRMSTALGDRYDVELGEDREGHHGTPLVCRFPGGRIYAALFGLKFGCTITPSRVSAVALTISSSQLTASDLVFLSISTSRNA